MSWLNQMNPNIRYGSTSPGKNWVYAGKTRNPTSPPKAGWQTIDYWKKAPAPAKPKTPPPPPAPAPAPAPTAPAPTQLPTNTYAPPPGPSMGDIASQFSSQIAAMQQGFQESMQQQASQFAQMQQVQQDRMEAVQRQMLQAQMSAANRPEVAGVKTATGSSGTDMQIARRGATGAFGRSGMRIKGLNV